MYRSPEIDIAAGGQSSRLREYLNCAGLPDNYPKMLLPTGEPDDRTLLGRIIRQAQDTIDDSRVTVHTTCENGAHISAHKDIAPLLARERASIQYGVFQNSFHPFIPKVMKERGRVIGASGDFYADLDWEELLAAHDSSDYPVTFLVGRTVVVEEGAAFTVEDDGRISNFWRPPKSEGNELINVGVYVFEPTKPVLSALADLVSPSEVAKEEVIVNRLIDSGLLGAYVLPSTPFNVNTPETYAALLEHTATQAHTPTAQ